MAAFVVLTTPEFSSLRLFPSIADFITCLRICVRVSLGVCPAELAATHNSSFSTISNKLRWDCSKYSKFSSKVADDAPGRRIGKRKGNMTRKLEYGLPWRAGSQ